MEKKYCRDKEGQSILSRTQEGAETRIAVHYKRQTHKPVEYERPQFSPRCATLFLPCNGESFNAGPADNGENFARERAMFVKLDIENDA